METVDVVALRLRLGYTQSEFAGRLGVSPRTVEGWETGHHIPSRRALAKIERLIESREEHETRALAP